MNCRSACLPPAQTPGRVLRRSAWRILDEVAFPPVGWGVTALCQVVEVFRLRTSSHRAACGPQGSQPVHRQIAGDLVADPCASFLRDFLRFRERGSLSINANDGLGARRPHKYPRPVVKNELETVGSIGASDPASGKLGGDIAEFPRNAFLCFWRDT